MKKTKQDGYVACAPDGKMILYTFHAKKQICQSKMVDLYPTTRLTKMLWQERLQRKQKLGFKVVSVILAKVK